MRLSADDAEGEPVVVVVSDPTVVEGADEQPAITMAAQAMVAGDSDNVNRRRAPRP